MSKIKVNGVELYYEIHGGGEPLLLIEGLGYATWMWYRQVPELSRHYQVIIFDNRGVGESDKPDIPYSIKMMAADAAELLRVLGFQEAHVLGASMGGYIAQALAANYGRLTKKLILACTSFGGSNAVAMPQETLDAMTKVEGKMPEEALLQGMATAFTPGFMEHCRDEVQKIAAWRLAKPTPRYSWQRQFEAVQKANLEDEISAISAPTLILTGEEDKVIPAENSKLLQKKIPNSKLRTLTGAGHLFFIERNREFNSFVLDFLKEN